MMRNVNQRSQQKSQNFIKREVAFRCQICLQITLANRKFKNSNNCVHPFCTTCIIKYIKVKLEDKVSDVKCPAANCNHSLEPLSCRPKIIRELFNKWCDVLYETAVLKVDRAYCPNRNCSVLMLNECTRAGSLKRCVCPCCKKPFCFRCKVPWHAGFSCDGSRMMRDENDVAFRVLCEKKMWRRCPGCKFFVERISGCDIIICRCGTSFNYSYAPTALSLRTAQDHQDDLMFILVLLAFLMFVLVFLAFLMFYPVI